MNIAFAASEGVPFSKTGGLADVVGALPRALAALGHQVSVYLPRYRQTRLADPETVVRSITIPFDDRYRFCSMVSGGKHGGVQFYFVEYPPSLIVTGCTVPRRGTIPTMLSVLPCSRGRFWRARRSWGCRRFFTATTGSRH